MNEQSIRTFDDILRILPHRPPFLFVDRVTMLVPGVRIVAERDLRPDEPHFAGHFPGKPIMPGVLVTDALAQTSGLLWGLSVPPGEPGSNSQPRIFFLAAASMKFTSPAVPGETLQLHAAADKNFGKLFTYTVEANVGRKIIAKGSLTLAMMEGSP